MSKSPIEMAKLLIRGIPINHKISYEMHCTETELISAIAAAIQAERAKVEVAVKALEKLKIAVEDKGPDKGAVRFIEQALKELESL